MAGIARNHQLSVIAVGGTQNHAHLFLELPPDVTLSDAVRVVKCNSSRWLRESVRLFCWQEGYAAFSVSPSQAGGVLRYVEHQAEHHARYSFDEELRALMKAAGVEPKTNTAPEGAEDS
jgi:putative transposase